MNEQVTIRDKHNKKRIQPAMLVRKDEVQKVENTQKAFFANNSLLYSTINSFEPLILKPVSQNSQIIKIGKSNFL